MSNYTLYEEMLETIQIYIKFLNEADKVIMSLHSSELRPGLGKVPVFMDEIYIGDIIDEIGGVWCFEPKELESPDLRTA